MVRMVNHDNHIVNSVSKYVGMSLYLGTMIVPVFFLFLQKILLYKTGIEAPKSRVDTTNKIKEMMQTRLSNNLENRIS